MMMTETIAVFCEQYETLKYTVLGFFLVFIVKADGADSCHSALKCY
jgi:hypothetical protein